MSKLLVFYDGQCPMCAAAMSRLAAWDPRAAVRAVDVHDPVWHAEARERFSEEHLQQEMVVRLPNGTWRSGYFAWATILGFSTRFHWLGAVLGLPVFYGIGPVVYQWVAARRLLLSRLLKLPAPCEPSGSCRIPSA